nr:HAMP domain-containing sensor histidine kinase [Nocardioides panaciterrulae]
MTIRAEQRLTAELAHELRTPLAAIQGSADLALLRGGLSEEVRADLEQVAASSRVMAETISTLLDLARRAGDEPTATCRLGDVVEAVRPLVPAGPEGAGGAGGGVVGGTGDGGVGGTGWSEAVPDPAVRLAAPRDLVVRALSPVIENAVRHARSAISLRAVASASAVELHVHDDGPGVDDSVREQLFAPGTVGPGGGTGLGLGIARRVARSIGGDVELAEDDGPGATFVVRVPRL